MIWIGLEGEKIQEERLLISNCTMINRELFFVQTQHGLPAKMNLDKGDVSYCNFEGDFRLRRGDVTDDICMFGGCVYALETSGKKVIIFDLEKLQCQYIPLYCAYREWGNFIGFEQYGSKFYIFPRYGNKICIMDIVNNKISEIENLFDGITELQCSCRIKHNVWLLPYDADVLGCYDLSKGEMQLYKLNRKVDHCVSAVYAEDSIYILNRFGIIFRWDMQECRLYEAKRIDKEYHEDKSLYIKMIYAGKKLIILPSLAEEIKIWDLQTNKTEVYRDYPKDFYYYMNNMQGWAKYQGMCEDKNYYYMAMRRENYLLKINKQTGTLSWLKPRVPSRNDRIKIENALKERGAKMAFALGERLFLETDMDLKNFLKQIPQNKYILKKTNIGSEIFKRMK